MLMKRRRAVKDRRSDAEAVEIDPQLVAVSRDVHTGRPVPVVNFPAWGLVQMSGRSGVRKEAA